MRKATSNIPITAPPRQHCSLLEMHGEKCSQTWWLPTSQIARNRPHAIRRAFGFSRAPTLSVWHFINFRVARGFEDWNLDPNDLQILKTAADNIKSGQVVDESIPEPPIPDEDDDYEPDDCHSMATPVILALLRPQSFHLWCLKSPQLSKQAQKMQHRQAHTYQVASNHSTSIRQTHTNTTNQYNGHLNVHSPTYQQTNIQRAPTFGFEPFRQFAHLSAEHGMGAEHQSDRTTQS